MKKMKALIATCALLGSFWLIYNKSHGDKYYTQRCIAFGGSRFAMQRDEFIITAKDFDGMCYAHLTPAGYKALASALKDQPDDMILDDANIDRIAAGDQSLKYILIELKNEIPEDNQTVGALKAKLPELKPQSLSEVALH